LFDRIENILPNAPIPIIQIFDRLKQLIQRIAGWSSPPELFKDKINFKNPQKGEFPAHQDALAGWEEYSPRHMTLAISLDPSTKENGALEFVRQSHKSGLLSTVGSVIPESLVDRMTWELIETNPGDIIIFDSYTPHRSQKNLSNSMRRMMFVTYIPIEYYNRDAVREKILNKRKKQPTIDDEINRNQLIRDSYGKHIVVPKL
jgi:ectoine hydroxylase-related dioxygenase (phytanoyl-CoA dioxygenase family)